MSKSPKNKPKTFKDYYADPEFRRKHLDKMKQRVKCECGYETSRTNISRHKRSRNHANRMKAKKLDSVEELKRLRMEVVQKLEELEKLVSEKEEKRR